MAFTFKAFYESVMKTTKSFFYGLLLVTGLASCSKDYNSSPGANGNAFGGSNPVAPITGAAPGEMVFKENGSIVRLKDVIWLDDGFRRRITGGALSADGTTQTGYTIEFRYYNNGGYNLQQYYSGSGKQADSFYLGKAIINVANPTLESTIQYYSGALSVNVPGYCSGKFTDTANNTMKGEFSGRLVRRDFSDLNKDFGNDFIDISSGFFNARMFMP